MFHAICIFNHWYIAADWLSYQHTSLQAEPSVSRSIFGARALLALVFVAIITDLALVGKSSSPACLHLFAAKPNLDEADLTQMEKPRIWHVQNDIKQLWTDIFFDSVSSKYPDMLSDISSDIWQSPNIWTDKTTKHITFLLAKVFWHQVWHPMWRIAGILAHKLWDRTSDIAGHRTDSTTSNPASNMTYMTWRDTAFQRTCPRHLDTRDVAFSILLVPKMLNGIWDTSHLTSALASQEEQKIIYHPSVLKNLPSWFVGTRHYFEYLGCLKKATWQPITKAPFCKLNHLRHHHRDLIPSQVGSLERLSGLQE